MDRFRRTPEDSGRRSTSSSKAPPFAGSASATTSFMHGIINRRSSTSNSTGNKSLEHGEARGDGNLAGHGTSISPAKSTPGFFDNRGHLGFPRHSNENPSGPFSRSGSGAGASGNVPDAHPPKAPMPSSKISQSYSTRMPFAPFTPNCDDHSAPIATTSTHEGPVEPPTVPRFLLGKSSSPARAGKRALSPINECSSDDERSSVASRMLNGEPSEPDNKLECVNNNRKGKTLVDRARTSATRLGVGHHSSAAMSRTNGTAPDGRKQGGDNVLASRAPQSVANRTPMARLGCRDFQIIDGYHGNKTPSEAESPQRSCTPVPTPSAPRGPSKAAGSRRSLLANTPSGSSNSTDNDRVASSPSHLNTIAEKYDPFDDVSAAEDESFAKAAASIQKLRHQQLCIRGTIARSHSRLLQGDNGMKMLADADNLLAKASNLLAEINIEACTPPQNGTETPEDRKRHQQLPHRRREAESPAHAQRLSLPATHLRFGNEPHFPPSQGNQRATAQPPGVDVDPDPKDAMDTSG